MLSIVISDIVADLFHQFNALATHNQDLFSYPIGSNLLTIAIIHGNSENAIGYKAVSWAMGHVDGCRRQRKTRGLRADSSKTSCRFLAYLSNAKTRIIRQMTQEMNSPTFCQCILHRLLPMLLSLRALLRLFYKTPYPQEHSRNLDHV